MRIFPYFGAKNRLAKLYPQPLYPTILEPFAGSAAYSQLYWNRDVQLFDTWEIVISAWRYLITATEEDIRALPNVAYRDDVFTYEIDPGAAALISLFNYDGFAHIGNRVGKRCMWNSMRLNVAKLTRQRRFAGWHASMASFEDVPNIVGTWFIDPPYEIAGKNYKFAKVDYIRLAEFIATRRGQVIVCENTQSKWLSSLRGGSIQEISPLSGLYHKTTEIMWYSERQNV